MKSLFPIEGYLAVIPHIQNIYPPEKREYQGKIQKCVSLGWSFGFKYTSGVFEYFYFRTLQEAKTEYQRLEKAVEDYYANAIIKFHWKPSRKKDYRC